MRRPEPNLEQVPEDERPRERLLTHGSHALTDTELIAILLRTGRRGVSVLELARQVLEGGGGLRGLVGTRVEDILRHRGLGAAKAAGLVAALEIGRRLVRPEFPVRQLLDQPDQVASYLALRYWQRDQEVMGALYLDRRNALIGEREVFRGTLSRAAVEPREILRDALLRGASGLVLFHTHPSGDPSPSLEDFDFTEWLASAAALLGVRLVDHLVLGNTGSWVSLQSRRAW